MAFVILYIISQSVRRDKEPRLRPCAGGITKQITVQNNSSIMCQLRPWLISLERLLQLGKLGGENWLIPEAHNVGLVGMSDALESCNCQYSTVNPGPARGRKRATTYSSTSPTSDPSAGSSATSPEQPAAGPRRLPTSQTSYPWSYS